MRARYRVRLSETERQELTTLTRRGHHSARRLTRARILLLADGGASDRAIAAALQVDRRTCVRIRRRAVTEGVEAALAERPRPGARPKLDARQAAHLIALACAEPPTGRATWTMQLLADRLVELELVESISDETVRRTLKKTI
jgi:transposase